MTDYPAWIRNICDTGFFKSRVNLIKAAIIIAFISGIFFSLPLWTNGNRFFPLVRPFEIIPLIEAPYDAILLSLFIGVSIIWIFYGKRTIGIPVFIFLTVILSQDQMRWQPWVYLYFLMLLPYLIVPFTREPEKSILISLKWIIAGVYVWSGIQKLNPAFIDGTIVQVIKVSGIKTDFGGVRNLGYTIPVIELSIGLGLLIVKFRRVALIAAITTHALILVYLIPYVLNQNTVVYPWNVAMIFFVSLLFWDTKEDHRLSVREISRTSLTTIPVVLVWVVPALNFFGLWDHYLSFSLYSNKPSTFYIAIEESEIQKVDKRFKNYFGGIPGLRGGQLIDINKWSYAELNVPFYPETKAFKKVSASFCELGIADDKLIFLELLHSKGQIRYNKFTCSELRSH